MEAVAEVLAASQIYMRNQSVGKEFLAKFSPIYQRNKVFKFVLLVICQLKEVITCFFSFKDECSFVSLRDVERAMQVMVWFYEHMDTLGESMDKVIADVSTPLIYLVIHLLIF